MSTTTTTTTMQAFSHTFISTVSDIARADSGGCLQFITPKMLQIVKHFPMISLIIVAMWYVGLVLRPQHSWSAIESASAPSIIFIANATYICGALKWYKTIAPTMLQFLSVIIWAKIYWFINFGFVSTASWDTKQYRNANHREAKKMLCRLL